MNMHWPFYNSVLDTEILNNLLKTRYPIPVNFSEPIGMIFSEQDLQQKILNTTDVPCHHADVVQQTNQNYRLES